MLNRAALNSAPPKHQANLSYPAPPALTKLKILIMKPARLTYVLCSAAVLLLQNPAFAGDELSLAEPSLSKADELLFQDIPSVYSASKYEQKVTKAPASISIVTADDIKKYGYRTFGEILSSLKGFYHTYDRGYGFAGTRGFGLPSDFNTRLLLLVDGHRYNENIFDSFDSAEAFPLDIDAIERVEVVRGPGSSLYGSNAVFGVVNVITKRGRDLQGANVKASYGSFDAYKTSLSYGKRYNNGVEASLTGTFYDSQGNSPLYYPEFDSPATNNGMSSHNDEDQSKKLMGKISYSDFTLQGLYAKRNKDIPTASFGTVFNDPNENTVDEQGFLDLKYDHTFDNQLNLQSRVSYNQFIYRGNYPYDYSSTAIPNIVINKDFSRGRWWRAELEASKVVWDDHRLTAGGEFQSNFEQLQANYDISTYLYSQESTYKWAVFLQDEYSVTKKLTFNAGVRLDYFSIFGKTINPRLGLIYDLWDTTSVKLLYGTAFRAPNQFELNYFGTGIIPNPNLKPEKFETLELILEHYFNDHLHGEFNIFHSDITDIIEYSTTGGGSLQNRNTGDVESKGIEVQLEDGWADGFKGRVSYSWQETINKITQQRLSNSPEHMIKLNLIAPVWNDKVFVGFETQYMSSRRTLANRKADDHVINNLTIFTQNWLKGLELSGGIYNMFDQRYFDPGSAKHRQDSIEQDGLTFRIKASLDF
jgi:outer membrane receptor for ferrienterochelin and colicins